MIRRIVRPGVEIQQIFLEANPNLTTPELPTVVVGINRQVVSQAVAGDYAKGSDLTVAYPGIEVAAVVEPDTVAVRLRAVFLEIFDGGAITGTFASDKMTIVPAGGNDFTTKAVAVGDEAVVTSGGVTYRAKVTSVDSASVVTLDRDIPFATPATFVVERKAADTTLPSTAYTVGADDVTLSNGLLITTLPVLRGEVLITFKAVRQLTANRLTNINLATEIEAKLMAANTDNPLALGAAFAKANTVSSVLAMAVEEDTPIGWLTALDFLQNEPVHCIVLLTQNPTIHGFLKTHVEQLSTPEKSKFRIGFVNYPHPRESLVVSQLDLAKIKRVTGEVTITQPVADFAGSVLVGDFIEAILRTGTSPTSTPAHAGFWRVTEVKNQTTLKLQSAKYLGEVGEGVYVEDTVNTVAVDFADDFVDLRVFRVLDKDGQADAIAALASSINSRRIVYIPNHEVEAQVGATSGVVLPGFYLCAAYGGMCAGFPPHQGFTNLAVIGFERVRYASRYWTDDQMGLIAGSGAALVVQDSDTSLPAMYIQTTTDNSTVQRQELSITRTLDFYSIGLKARLGKYIGPYNRIAATLTDMKNDIDGYHSGLLKIRYPNIGSPIISGVIKELIEDEFEADAVRLVTDVEIPTPINRIRATVEVLG